MEKIFESRNLLDSVNTENTYGTEISFNNFFDVVNDKFT